MPHISNTFEQQLVNLVFDLIDQELSRAYNKCVFTLREQDNYDNQKHQKIAETKFYELMVLCKNVFLSKSKMIFGSRNQQWPSPLSLREIYFEIWRETVKPILHLLEHQLGEKRVLGKFLQASAGLEQRFAMLFIQMDLYGLYDRTVSVDNLAENFHL